MKIHAIQTGIVHVKRNFIPGTAAAPSKLGFMVALFSNREWVDLPIYAWVIEHDEGVIVVDTGDRADSTSNFISQSRYTIRPEEEIHAQMKALGIATKDVSKVILTHLHGDHVNGVTFFEGRDIYLGRDEYAAYQTRFGGMFSRRTTRLPAWFNPKPLTVDNQPFGAFPYSFPITRAGDVVAVPTPGHTGGHISVVATHDGIAYFMAGDVTYDLAGLLSQVVQGPSLNIPVHTQTLKHTLDFARSRPTVYLPAHDWQSGERLTQSTVIFESVVSPA